MSIFNKVEAPSLPKYKYNLSHEFKFTGNFGQLLPIAFHEVLPGDTFKMNSELFMRMAPLVHPILQRINVDIHHFFVPYRIIWDEWESFITGFSQKQGLGEPVPTSVPKINFDITLINPDDGILRPTSLPHFFGVPLHFMFNSEESDFAINALPFRAYAQIWNDYYRDSIKQAPIDFSRGSIDLGYNADDEANMLMVKLRRCYAQDYFTTAQENPQLGDPAVLPSPIVTEAIFTESAPTSTSGTIIQSNQKVFSNNNGVYSPIGFSSLDGNYRYRTDDSSSEADSSTEFFTINKLRELFALQKLFDIGNKFGSRYAEQTLGHFGVRSSDARLQRAQFLGGGRVPVMINQISQLSQSTEDSPLGYQGGQGIASGSDNYFSETFNEHGIIISILSVLPEANYTHGINRFMLKSDRFDFAFPELAQIGEQEVFAHEYNCLTSRDNVFGYQERYAEYKTSYNRVAGDFLTDLNGFYLAPNQGQIIDITDDPFVVNLEDLQNIFAVTDGEIDKLYFQVYHNIEKDTVLPYLNRIINQTSYI